MNSSGTKRLVHPSTLGTMVYYCEAAILAGEGISIDILRERPPRKVTRPPDSVYEEDMTNSTTKIDQDPRKKWVTEKKVAEQMSEDWSCRNPLLRPSCSSLGGKWHQIRSSQEPIHDIEKLTTKEMWVLLNNIFTKQRNITFHRYIFFTSKQLQGGTNEKFYSCLRELSFKCDLGCHEDSSVIFS